MKEKESLDPDHGLQPESGPVLAVSDPQFGAEEGDPKSSADGPSYLFRGDDNYKGGRSVERWEVKRQRRRTFRAPRTTF